MGRSSGNVHQCRLPPIINATRPLSVAGEAGIGGARMTGGCGTGASETGGVAEGAASFPAGDARETPPRTLVITDRRIPGMRVEQDAPDRGIRDRPVPLLCARFLRAMCVVTGGNYTSRGTPGPRNGPGRESHSFPGTARASATEVDVRRAGGSSPRRRCGELRGKVSSTWSTSGRRAVPGTSQSPPNESRISLVAPTRVVRLYPRYRALSTGKYYLW